MSSNNWSQSHHSSSFLPFLVQNQIYGNSATMNVAEVNYNQLPPVPLNVNISNNEATNFASENDRYSQYGNGVDIQPGPSGLIGAVNIPVESGNTLVLHKDDYQSHKEYIYRVKNNNKSIVTFLRETAGLGEYEDEDLNEKKIRPTCKNNICRNSEFRFCATFSETTRQKIFDEFWKTLNWDQRHIFVATHVFRKPKIDETKNEDDFIYILRNSNGNDEQVCEEMFLNTLDLTINRVRVWVDKYSIGGSGSSMYKEEFKKKLTTIKIFDPNDYDEHGLPKKKRKYKKKKSKKDPVSGITRDEFDPNCPNKPPRKKNTIKPEFWKCNVVKKLRLEGKEYYSKNIKTGEMVLHKGKNLGPRCTSNLCRTSKLRNCTDISEQTREKIFNDIWQRWDWQQRKIWVASMVKRKATTRKRTLSINSKRQATLHYFLPDNNGIPVQVCAQMFLSTTGIGHHQTLMWSNAFNLGSNVEEHVSATKDADSSALDWINDLPKYTFGSNCNNKYLDPQFRDLGDLYKIYSEKCKNEGIPLVQRYQMKNIIKSKNIHFVPQNDEECPKCKAYAKTKSDSDESFQYHKNKVEKAIAEKLKDQKKAASGLKIVLQIHLQPTKTVPILRNQSQLYNSKLQCNNLSIHDIKQNYTTCYFFTEDQCDKMAENFQSIITTIICEHLKENYFSCKKKNSITIYCNGSNKDFRNVILANALLNLATIYNIKISQKFFETGHSLVEDCYKAHQMLERFLNTKNKEIYLPSQLAKTVREIKRYPEVNTAVHLNYDFFQDFTKPEFLRYKSIHPGDGFEENDACEMQYLPTGKIILKLDFGDDSMELLQRTIKDFKPVLEYPFLYTDMATISKTKWDDLQDMKKFLPFDCQPFYDSLKYYEDYFSEC